MGETVKMTKATAKPSKTTTTKKMAAEAAKTRTPSREEIVRLEPRVPGWTRGAGLAKGGGGTAANGLLGEDDRAWIIVSDSVRVKTLSYQS